MKKLLSVILALVMVLAVVPLGKTGIKIPFSIDTKAIYVSDKNNKYTDDYVYQIIEWDWDGIETGVNVVKYMGDAEEVVVPETIAGLPVVSMCDYAFSPLYREPYESDNRTYEYFNNEAAINIRKIVLPDTVGAIDWYAFAGCKNLEEVTMPSSLGMLAGYAFQDTKVKKLDINSNYEIQIYNEAFALSDIEELSIKAQGLELMGLENDSIKKLTVDAPDADVSFYGSTTLEELIFENSVAVFDSWGNTKSKPQTVVFKSTFPDAMYGRMRERSYIYAKDDVSGTVTFYQPGEDEIMYDEESKFRYYINNKGQAVTTDYNNTDKDENIVVPETLGGAPVVEIGSLTFRSENAETITISDSVEKIGSLAFYSSRVSSVYFGKNVKTIGESAFYECSHLKNISLNENLERIEAYAFYKCEALTDIVIPEKVTKIDDFTFFDCALLSSVTAKGVVEIGEEAFSNTYWEGLGSLVDVEFSEDLHTVGDFAFADSRGLADIGVSGEKIKNLGMGAFTETAITSFTFSDELKEIPKSAFKNCKSLAEITLSESIEAIGTDAFRGCTMLEEVVIGSNVTSIVTQAFRDCTALTKVVIPPSVTYIADSAFSGCSNLTIYCVKDSIAHKYALESNRPFVLKEGEAMPHVFGEWKNIVEPTQTEDGLKERTCTICGEKEEAVALKKDIRVTLTDTEGTVIRQQYISGDSTEIIFRMVFDGEYTVTVERENYATRKYTVITTEEDNLTVSTSFSLNFIGDINGDGKVNTLDVAQANAHAKGVTSLSDYGFSCADANGDGKVNTLDVARMNAHAKNISTLW